MNGFIEKDTGCFPHPIGAHAPIPYVAKKTAAVAVQVAALLAIAVQPALANAGARPFVEARAVLPAFQAATPEEARQIGAVGPTNPPCVVKGVIDGPLTPTLQVETRATVVPTAGGQDAATVILLPTPVHVHG